MRQIINKAFPISFYKGGCAIGWDDTKRDRGYSLQVAAHPCRAAQFAYPPRLCPLCPKHAIKSAPPQLSTVSYANVGREPYSPRDVESERGERERKKKKERKNGRKGEKKRVRSRRACKIHPPCPPNPNRRSAFNKCIGVKKKDAPRPLSVKLGINSP